MKEVVFSDHVTKIGYGAFTSCNNLSHIIKGDTDILVQYVDGSYMEVLRKRKCGDMGIWRCRYFGEDEIVYVATDGELYAHGKTPRKAVNDLAFKKRRRDGADAVVQKIRETGIVAPDDYRILTGACQEGTQRFLVEKGFTWEDSIPLQKAIEITEGYFGHETFCSYFSELA